MSELSKVEQLKLDSNGLRGTISEELLNDESGFSKDTTNLIKFHGMYQQDDRDSRKDSKEKAYSLMIRGRIPGGRLTSEQYVVWDDVATKYSGSNSLRLTTRQSIQLHGVLKKNIKRTIQDINKAFITTQGACGDVVRNVTQTENPWNDEKISQLDAVAEELSEHFLAKTNSFTEIWLDGEQVNKDETETLYGATYLPRKFKIAVAIVGNNSVDIYTNDMGFAATFNSDNIIDGFFVFAGGGMGMTHKKETTFPRVADEIGWIPKEKLIEVSESIISIHRDFGNRDNRKNARLKYVIAEKGIEWFKGEVEKRASVTLEPKQLPKWETPNLLGWTKSSDSTWSYGLHLVAGRVTDTENVKIKSGLREVVEKFKLDVQVTADQSVLLLNIKDEEKLLIACRLKEFGIVHQNVSKLESRALACVALPTCGLAITEAERYLPESLLKIDQLLEKYQLQDRSPVFRITGCPNGCARPYAAELAFVGRSKNSYSIFAGGSAEGDRIAKLLEDNVKEDVIYDYLDQLFLLWKNDGDIEELLGDFVNRLSVEIVADRIKQLEAV